MYKNWKLTDLVDGVRFSLWHERVDFTSIRGVVVVITHKVSGGCEYIITHCENNIQDQLVHKSEWATLRP